MNDKDAQQIKAEFEDEMETCPACNGWMEPGENPVDGCDVCRAMLPPSLIKATCDPFDYALKLRTGEIIQFSEAVVHGDYVTLTIQQEYSADPDRFPLPFRFERGVDVRVSDIVWCADAPSGS